MGGAKCLAGCGDREQSGISPIEILMVLGVIVALAAAMVPLMVGMTSGGAVGTRNAERSAVQLSMDAMLADVRQGTVDAQNSPTASFSSLPTGAAGIAPLSGYLPSSTTTYCYTWDTTGRVLTQTKKSGSPPVC